MDKNKIKKGFIQFYTVLYSFIQFYTVLYSFIQEHLAWMRYGTDAIWSGCEIWDAFYYR